MTRPNPRSRKTDTPGWENRPSGPYYLQWGKDDQDDKERQEALRAQNEALRTQNEALRTQNEAQEEAQEVAQEEAQEVAQDTLNTMD